MNPKPKVSIIIVSYNVAEFIQPCLESIFTNGSFFSFDVWVVDNQSTDQSVAIIEKKFPTVRLIKSTTNLGFAAANNLAILKSNGDYVWFLNPDTVVFDGALDSLAKFLDVNPQYGSCGSRLLNPDQSLQISAFPFPTSKNEFFRLTYLDKLFKSGTYQMNQWDTSVHRDVDVNQGASLMFRRSVLEEIGLFDEQFFMYTEEVDLCYRLKNAGWKNAWIPESIVVHYGGLSTRQNKTAMFLQLYQTKIQFFRKHYSNKQTRLYKSILFFASILRIIPLSVTSIIKADPNQKNLVQNYRKLLRFLPGY